MAAIPNWQRGVTLAELMIALALSLLLMAGVVTVFISNKTTFKLQEGMSQNQENGRFALQLLGRELRGSGYWGCGTNPVTTNVPAKTINSLPNSTYHAFSFASPVEGFEWTGADSAINSPANSDWSSSTGGSLPSNIVTANDFTVANYLLVGGSDIVTVRFAQGDAIQVDELASSGGSPTGLIVKDATGPSAGDIMMISDCYDRAFFQVEGYSGGQLTFANIGATLANQTFTAGEILPVHTRTYFVALADDDGDGNADRGPSLWRTDNGNAPQELVEGVEAIALSYREDTDGDGIPESNHLTADAVSDWNEVKTIRVQLLVRSLDENIRGLPEEVANVAQSALTFNGVAFKRTTSGTLPSGTTVGDLGDLRLRDTLATTVALRNLTR